MSSGANFGADFAVYEGDPAEFHASHLVMAGHRRGKVGFHELMAMERVARSARKKVLVPFWGEEGTLEFL